MSLPQEVVEEVFTVIEGGKTLGTPADIIQFHSDNGQNTYNVVKKLFQGDNGTGFNYWVVAFQTLVGEVSYAVSAGAAMLTMEVGAVGLAVAPALGLTTGYVLYKLNPQFWKTVSDALVEAGQTIGGKVVVFMNENGTLTYTPETIEIIKNKLLEIGAFEYGKQSDLTEFNGYMEQPIPTNSSDSIKVFIASDRNPEYTFDVTGAKVVTAFPNVAVGDKYWYMIGASDTPDGQTSVNSFTHNGKTVYYHAYGGSMPFDVLYTQPSANLGLLGKSISTSNWGDDVLGAIAWTMMYGENYGEGNVQEGAVLPDEDPFPLRYPEWYPYEFPDVDGQQMPSTYPLQYPDLLPEIEPYQEPAQNPEQEPDPVKETNPETVIDPLQDPDNAPNSDYDPTTDPDPSPDPTPDPDTPSPNPEPIEPTPDPSPEPDPVDPNPEPTPSPIIPIPNLPDTVSSSKLFTVYNPSQSQLDSLGGYLWDSSIMASIRDIWQNPLDGIISLIQVYATPTVSGSHNIILGYLDSGVSSPVVSSQFVTIDCGTVQIKEKRKNATDYTPYVSLHLYLPFIGFVELDTNECMNGSISIKYKIDVYTGTCLALVSVNRAKDMPNNPILYTYSGNCSQQIPLTSGNATGMLSALIGGITAGLSVASGGGLGVVAGMSIAGKSLTHEMFHVSHSGNISANAGIMGNKKPYIVIGRRKNYDANNYNKYYGFPVNKSVVLSNHSGFVKVKKCLLKTNANETEYNEIIGLLNNGVIL